MKKTFDSRWDDIYSKKQQLNLYPFNDLVSFYYKNYSSKKNNKVLEIGCGFGNNLIFISKMGHETFGFDASASVIKQTRIRFKKENIKCELSVQDFTSTNYKSNYFNLVINREVLQHSDFNDALKGMIECNRVLKRKGILYSNFKSNLTSRNNLGRTYLKTYNSSELRKLFTLSKFKITDLFLNTKKSLINSNDTNSYWTIIAQKN